MLDTYYTRLLYQLCDNLSKYLQVQILFSPGQQLH